MRNAPPKEGAGNDSRELQSLSSTFIKIRILHHASAGLISRSATMLRLRAHGCDLGPTTLQRLLVSMTRNGWLKVKTTPGSLPQDHCAYSLTPKGRQALEKAKQHLTQLEINSA